MRTTVVKFGGSSLASAEQFRKVADIIRADEERRYVVASAPGKRHNTDTKVTDMLYRCCAQAEAGEDFEETLGKIRDRFADIISGLGIEFDLKSEIEIIHEHLSTDPQKHYMASRGEYLNSKILARYLGFDFVDAAAIVRFEQDGTFDSETTNHLIRAALENVDYAVVPGFYGTLPDGTVHTFSRGGSDVTGALVARAVEARLYENWTDVSGMLSADPRIVDNPQAIDFVSYYELRELSYMGASVLHEDAVFPVRKAGIPINIRNTNRPEDDGTMITGTLPRGLRPRTVTGIAGRKGFCSVQVEHSLMNNTVGFVAKLLTVFADHGVSFEHCPTGIDTMSVIVDKELFQPKRSAILKDIRDIMHPDVLLVEENIALIAVVGQGMAYSKGVSARIFSALYEAGINIRMIDQGSSELNIIIGVEEEDYETAIRAIYRRIFE